MYILTIKDEHKRVVYSIAFTLLIITSLLVACNPSPMANAVETATPAAAAAKVTPTKAPTNTSTSPPLPAFSHIFIIVMENKEESSVKDNPAAPYLNKLAEQYARAAN